MKEISSEFNSVMETWCICDIGLWIPVMFKSDSHVNLCLNICGVLMG